MKTFEEELTIAIIAHYPNFKEQQIVELKNAILAAHQAEMDRVVETVIGDDEKGCKSHRDDPSWLCSSGSCLAATSVNTDKAQRRARYKAIKERK